MTQTITIQTLGSALFYHNMKTMLNKLLKTGLFSNGLLLVVAIGATAGTILPTVVPQTVNDTLQYVRFDPELLQLSGLPEGEAANVPTIELNKNAESFLKDYVAKNSRLMEQIKARSTSPFATMDAVFSKYNLPKELKYLAVIESHLKPRAVSHAGAVGTWQFMAVTARSFSLKVTAKYDERTNMYKSTVAAAKYLSYLHDMYGDWLLVIAAYNAGPGNVNKAIKRSGSRNFWKLQHFLPAETRGHVKKFISTQYYFEGKGSVTTLTKAEVEAYSQKMIEFVAKQNLMLEEKMLAKNTIPVSAPAGGDKIAEVPNINMGLRPNEEE
jgi:membrane-bound lytic murein transglycosylase D